MGIGLILESNCLGVTLSLFLEPHSAALIESSPLPSQGGVSVTQTLHLAPGCLPGMAVLEAHLCSWQV